MSSTDPYHPPAPGAQRAILRRLFLLIALRGQGRGRSQPKKRPPYAMLGIAILAYTAVGCIAFGTAYLPLFAFVTCLHSMTFLLAGVHLASMSGQVLFSPQESDVLLHRPIVARELLAAKVETIVIIALGMATAMNLAGFYIGTSHSGSWLFIPVHLLAVTLEVLFSTSFVTLAYNLCLRNFGRERLDNVMTTVQMTVAVGIMVGAQIIPRVMRTMDFSALAHPPLWLGALPPVWFASLEMVLLGRAGAPIYFVFAGLGVVFTVVTAWLGVARLADSYAAGLVALNEAGSNAGPRKQRGRWATLLLRIPLVSWWLRDPVERASFSLTLSQLGRSRGVKLRVYPQAAQFMIYPVIFFFGVGSSPGVNAFSLAFAGAFLAMLPSTIIEQLRSSEDWQAADVFFAAPIARASSLFHGVRKAVIVGLVAPGLVFVALIGLVGLRDPRLLVVLLPGLVALPLFSQLAGVGKSFVPFSQPPAKTNTTGRGCLIIVISLILSLAVAGLAGWAWLEHRLGLMLAIEIPIVFAVSLLMRRSMAGMTLRGEA